MSTAVCAKIFAVAPRTERGCPVKLNGSPDGRKLLYCHGHSVVIRDVDDPVVCDVYTQHSADVLVAKYSPSSYYIASADKKGKIRIWDTVNEEHILKNEFQPLSGPIYDLDWSPDSQRIVVGGHGRETFGHVFLADTGTSNGVISGSSKPLNSVHFRPKRPFRILTGSEDCSAVLLEGPPFKFKMSKTDHASYCQAVRYAPNGDCWASAGFDAKIFLYDANSGGEEKLIRSLTAGDADSAHVGGIYSISWSPDSKSLLSASGDKTCRLWDVEAGKCVQTFDMGTSQYAEGSILDQQLGCLWTADDKFLLSVSLSGRLNYLDARAENWLSRTVYGHSKPVTASTSSGDGQVMTGDSEGRLLNWDVASGRVLPAIPKQTDQDRSSLTTQVVGLKSVSSAELACISIDNKLRLISDVSDGEVKHKVYSNDTAVQFDHQPRGLASAANHWLVATDDGSVTSSTAGRAATSLGLEPACMDVDLSGLVVAVGGTTNQSVVLRQYSIDQGQTVVGVVQEIKTAPGNPTAIGFSPRTGNWLAITDDNRQVWLYKRDSGSQFIKAHDKAWCFHSARVQCLAWSADELYLATGGLDSSLIVWSIESPEKHLTVRNAHPHSHITSVVWIRSDAVVTTGQDGFVKAWDLKLDF